MQADKHISPTVQQLWREEKRINSFRESFGNMGGKKQEEQIK